MNKKKFKIILLILLIPNLLIGSCLSFNNEYVTMNKRFDFDNINDFKMSINVYEEKLGINYDQKILKMVKVFDYTEIYEVIIKDDVYEEYISNNPYEIFSFIQTAKKNDKKDEIIFNSMNAFLRTLSVSML
tara:strand:+ start:239 stop:631 length:393 start_codon:yes stop_codon:yes gene_type:complete